MQRALVTIVVGVMVYISANMLITTLITGTDTGDVLMQTLLPLAIAIGVVLAGLTMFIKAD